MQMRLSEQRSVSGIKLSKLLQLTLTVVKNIFCKKRKPSNTKTSDKFNASRQRSLNYLKPVVIMVYKKILGNISTN